ncbi:MAG: SDR family oxidoreductase [Deltaproteobacteria bacterium]|nr:SDR family oxidoreductase [Deltaproteobacteria bacterium]
MENKKTALITGGAGVLGVAAASKLLERGCQVVLVDIDEQKLEQTATALAGNVHLRAFDISDPDAVEENMEQILKHVCGIDILLNNAGILSNHKSADTTPEEWQRILAVNLSGSFYISRLCIPGMKEKKWGRIINTTSVAAKTGGITAGTAYSASKGGMMSLTFSLAAELAPFGITVNGIAPAYVKTPMVTKQLSEKKKRELLKKIPVGRFSEPDEFAHVVSFLVDPLAGFITGEIIDINGGLYFD